ncbi:MAG: ABC transporter substrate-binding protein [Treponema sp.]|jgi:peptide/nickel transport system substrate-binding protein|nr:ABC transporter substrate-binding protein [Treponema sp.]
MMKKNNLAGICLVLIFVLALAPACKKQGTGQEEKTGKRIEGGELRFGMTTEPATLDPLNPSNSADGRSILFNVFEGLVKPDAEGNLQMAIAEKYTISPDARVYEFTLRQGVKFHDGTEVTAEDVVFTLNTAIKNLFDGFTGIEQVEISADRGIKITLKAPDPEFLPYLTIGIVPRNNPDREANPIGTGPFSIARYTTQQSLVLVKNPAYWQLPHLDEVTYIFVADSDALLLALQGGTIQAASITGSLLQQLDARSFDFVSTPSNAVQLMALNNAVKPLEDKRVRQAINYGVDIPQIIDAAFFGQGSPSGSPLIPGLTKYYDTSLKNPYSRDIPKARSLLAAAGYEQGFSLEITVPSNYTMHVDTAQVLVNQLGAIGITATIRLVDWATWLSDVYRGRHYQATIISLDAPNVSPRSFLSRYRSDANNNFVNFHSPAFDQVYDAVLIEPDEGKRVALYQEAQRILSEEAASVYIQDIMHFNTFSKGAFGGVVNYPLYVFDASTIYSIK